MVWDFNVLAMAQPIGEGTLGESLRVVGGMNGRMERYTKVNGRQV